MANVPTLHSRRLILRPHRTADWEDCAALWSDAEVVRHIGGAAQDQQAVWFRILRYAGMWSLLGYGMWVVEQRGTGAFVGEAGLLSAARGLAALEGVPEAGWALAPWAWGRGFATEAMAMVLEWADRRLDAPVVRCIIEPGNGASVRVARKLGFVGYGEARLGADVVRVFERVRVT